MTNNNHFCEILKKLNLHNEVSCAEFHKICPDRALPPAAFHNSEYWNRLKNDIDQPHQKSGLVIVMESPHIHEFLTKSTPLPAMGHTGRKIVRHLDAIVEQTNECFDEIFLVNAVQFQCSLGEATKSPSQKKQFKYRLSEVFEACWLCDVIGEGNFKTRLYDYIKDLEKAVVINACTSGEKNKRKHCVQSAINDGLSNLSQVKKFKVGHPSSWMKLQNRKLKEV